MMPDSTYVSRVAKLTDDEVKDALRNYDKYVDGMLLALLDECDKRNIQLQGTDRLRSMVEERLLAENAAEIVETEEIVVDQPLPVLFTKSTILGFSIFFSPFIGGILLAMNVNALKKQGAWQVVAIALGLTLLYFMLISSTIAADGILALVILGVNALVLSEVVWNRFIGSKVVFTRRNFIIPLLIMLAIVIPLAYYAYLHPEQMNLPTATETTTTK
jgi:hypothetical protein